MKQAGVMLIVKDGLILAISRRHNKNIFGLPGGKYDEEAGDRNSMDTAIRETREETSVNVTVAHQIYQRVELGDGPNGVDFYSTTYYAMEWDGEPQTSEEGTVKWLTAEELTATHAAFGDYNRKMLDAFHEAFPDVYIQGETDHCEDHESYDSSCTACIDEKHGPLYTTGQEKLIQRVKRPPTGE